MTILRFRVDVRQAVANGSNCPVDPPIVAQDFDVSAVTAEKRRLIASRLNSSGDVCSRREKDGRYSTQTTTGYAEPQERREEPHGLGTRAVRPQLVTAPDPSIDGLCAAIEAEEDAIASYAERKASEKAAEAARKRQEALADALDAPQRQSLVEYVWLTPDGEVKHNSHVYGDMLGKPVAAKYDREWLVYFSSQSQYLTADEDREYRERAERLDNETAERKAAAIAAAAERLRREQWQPRLDWIEQHGSKRLVRMMAEDIDCHATYQRERAQHEAAELERDLADAHPGWVVVDEDDVDHRVHDVSDRTLALLDAGRAMIPDCRLARYDGRYVCVAGFRGHVIVWPRD